MNPRMITFPDLKVLKAVLKMLVEVFGADAVYKEAKLQNDLDIFVYVARYIGGNTSPKVARIKAVRAMRMANSLKESKEWVEENCPNGGHDPL